MSIHPNINILIIGAGAIGCLVGGKLAASGFQVTIAGRPSFVKSAVRRGGLLLETTTDSASESVTELIEGITPASSVEHAFRQSMDQFDLALLTVKCYDTQAALRDLAEAAKSQNRSLPTVVSLQNGVGNEEMIATALGPAYAIAGIITTPVSVIEPGHVQINKPSTCIGLSPWHPAVSTAHFDAIEYALNHSGFSTSRYPNAPGMKWSKVLMNMLCNASCAILGLSPEELFADRRLADLEIIAWREALAVMRKANILPVNIDRYAFSQWVPMIRISPNALLRALLRGQISRGRGGKMPSLYLDLESGKGKSEVQWLNGAVVNLGKKTGIATPVNCMLTDVLMQLVQHPKKRSLWHKDLLRMQVTADEYRERAV